MNRETPLLTERMQAKAPLRLWPLLGAFYGILFIAFLVLFPKGGFKIGNLPITWGYIVFGGTLPLIALSSVARWGGMFSGRSVVALLCFVPFSFYCLFFSLMLGVESPGAFIANITNVFVIPFGFFICLSGFLDRTERLPFLLDVLKWCIFLAALYGIILFICYYFYGGILEIPYLTINGSEVDPLFKKNNRRGPFMKLVSTYNNGNLYGIATLMVLPLYCILEKKIWRQWIVRLAVIFTLSRSVWFAWIIAEGLMAVYVFRQGMRKILGMGISLMLLGMVLFGLVSLMGRGTDWLFDSELGGRDAQLDTVKEVAFLPTESIRSIKEMVYISIAGEYGVVGLVLFLLLLACPFVSLLFTGGRWAIHRACIAGAATYLAICFADGGFMFIPTMMFFWLVTALAWCANPLLAGYETGTVAGRTTSVFFHRSP